MRGERKYGLIALSIALLSIFIIWMVGFGQVTEKAVEAKGEKDTMFDYVQLINSVAWSIDSKYVEEVDLKELIYSGIQGMLDILDPFSAVQDKEAYEQLMEVTQGKYEGLGMAIALRNEIVTVISPIEGTPAYRKGIRAGDKIMEIDGKSTRDMTTEEASKLMRGSAGTKVILKIEREGLLEPLEYELERAVIQLKNVPYYGVIKDDIGYTRFSEESGKELQDALKDLKEKNIQGLILDLRSNGGGLLNEAVETANLFLEENKLIVYTQGREKERMREFLSRGPSLYTQGRVAVLVDEGTASASEIVAGAIQDWDRGVIIGETTFGKGLVQQVFEMPKDVHLKLTIAKYYIPSGRCIQKPERAKKYPSLSDEENADTLKEKGSEIFYTHGGRKVYGGGGIVPDVICQPEELEPIEIDLERKQIFFDFAVEYISKHPEITKDLDVTDEIVGEFKEFLKEKDFSYKTYVEMQLDTLEKTIKAQEQTELYGQYIDQLKRAVENEKKSDFDKSLDYIKKGIKRDILRNKFGDAAVYEESFTRTDSCIRKAVEILGSKDNYTSILQES
jgi:carboxyl-terminal processing protease